MGRVVAALAAAALAAVVLSACGSSGATRVFESPVSVHGSGAIAFVAAEPSTGFGVDNTALVAASPNGRVRDLTSSAAAESDAAWSADGSHVVFVRESTTGSRNGGVRLANGVYVWSPGHGAPQRIASCAEVCEQSSFAWSPDDRQIAFAVGGNAIEVMNADGSGLHTICDSTHCGWGLDEPAWSPDGRKLVFANADQPMGPVTDPSSIWVANADGSGVTRLTQLTCTSAADEQYHACARDTAPAWSPNGRLIAFSRWQFSLFPAGVGPTGRNGASGTTKGTTQRPVTTSLDVMHADGTHIRSLYTCSRGDYCDQSLPSAWAPNGTALAYAPTIDQGPTFRISTLAGETTRIRTCAGSRCVYPSSLVWSPSGSELAFLAESSPGKYSVWVARRDGSGLHPIASGADWCCLAWLRHLSLTGAKVPPTVPAIAHLHLSGTIAYDGSPLVSGSHHLLSLGSELHPKGIHSFEPSWSPDGNQIAFSGLNLTPNTNIYVADRNGRNVRVLTHFGSGASQPAWSPDGRTIAFVTDTGIGLVSATGGQIRSLTPGGEYPSWSPGGNELVFDRKVGKDGKSALFTIHADASGLRRLTHLPGEQLKPAWSPNGKEIAFEWETVAGDGLYLIRPDGTHLRRVTASDVPHERPAWSPDSRYLAIVAAVGMAGRTQLRVIDVENGHVSTVASVPGNAQQPTWSAR